MIRRLKFQLDRGAVGYGLHTLVVQVFSFRAVLCWRTDA